MGQVLIYRCMKVNHFLYLYYDIIYIYTDNITEPSNCFDGEVRLVGGETEAEGRVEVCASRAWGTVCSAGFGFSESQVICQQLGFQELGKDNWMLFGAILSQGNLMKKLSAHSYINSVTYYGLHN